MTCKDDNEEFPLHVFLYTWAYPEFYYTYIMLEHTASPLLFAPVIILCLYRVSVPIIISNSLDDVSRAV